MKRTHLRIAIAGLLLGALCPVLANGDIVDVCTFEGGTDGGPINPENGGLIEGTASGMRFSAPWRTALNGVYADNPSPPTVAFWMGGDFAEVTFDEPVGKVGFHYAVYLDVTMEAFDENGTLVGSATGANNYVMGQGWVVWDFLSVETAGNIITRVRITGNAGATLLDNFTTVIKDPLVEVEMDLKPENYPNEVDPFNLTSNKPLEVGVLSTADFDATTLDVATVTLGDPNLPGTVAALKASLADINGDGLLDVIVDFGQARDFGAAGALDGESTEVMLLGATVTGLAVRGWDEVRIVGK